MSDYILVMPRDDYAALMAAIADLEQSNLYPGRIQRDGLQKDAIETLSRIASDLDQQAQAQD